MIALRPLIIIICYYSRSEAGLRIFGGRDTRKDEFPFVVSLEERLEEYIDGKTIVDLYPICTGTALTASWILSAAHCANEEHFKDGNKKLIARYNSYFPKYQGYTSPVFEVKIHPAYAHVDDTLQSFEETLRNDLCLFRSENIVVGQYGKISAVEYISLIGHEAYVLGFGLPNTPQNQKPLQVLKGMLNKCLEDDPRLVSMLCVVPPCGLEATICSGDSGGPVLHSSGIVGINSMSADDCDEYTISLDPTSGTSASVVAMVSPVLDWISNVVRNKTSV